MFLNLEQNTIINTDKIIGVFDLDNTTCSIHTRNWLTKMQKANRVFNASFELPKSFVLCSDETGEIVYLSRLSPATILKKIKYFNLDYTKI